MAGELEFTKKPDECKVLGCSKPIHVQARRLCRMHYRRLMVGGSIGGAEPLRDIHGLSRTPTYVSWNAMLDRCTNAHHKNYPGYGGRGITVCERWLRFTNFYVDMGDRPGGMTLDRIDNDGNYEPGNCRWATPEEQSSNQTRNTHGAKLSEKDVVEIKGLCSQGHRHREIAARFGVCRSAISAIANGKNWSHVNV